MIVVGKRFAMAMVLIDFVVGLVAMNTVQVLVDFVVGLVATESVVPMVSR